MAIKPGDLDPPAAFMGSMAAEIEAELNRLLTNDHLDPLPMDESAETRDRRRLFVAIARGVVRHLVENRTAITVALGGGATVSPAFDVEDMEGL